MTLKTLQKMVIIMVFSMEMSFSYANCCWNTYMPQCEQSQPSGENHHLYKKQSVNSGSMAACLKRCELSNCVNGDPECPKTMLFVCKSDCNANINVYR